MSTIIPSLVFPNGFVKNLWIPMKLNNLIIKHGITVANAIKAKVSGT